MATAGAIQIQKIIAKIDVTAFSDTAKAITAVRQNDDAYTLFNLLFFNEDDYTQIVNPECMLAFLENSHLNHVLKIKDLELIMGCSAYALSTIEANNLKRTRWQKLMLAIARSPMWCRNLSYNYFLQFIQNNNLLTKMLCQSTFLKHLDFVNVWIFLQIRPDAIIPILNSILEILEKDSERKRWVINTLKWIFAEYKTAKNLCRMTHNSKLVPLPEIPNNLPIDLIVNSSQYQPLSEALMLEFNTDPLFAVEVLKDVRLCDNWLKLEKGQAYKHARLQGIHFKGLALHYCKTDYPKAMRYVEFISAEDKVSLKAEIVRIVDEAQMEMFAQLTKLSMQEAEHEIASLDSGKPVLVRPIPRRAPTSRSADPLSEESPTILKSTTPTFGASTNKDF
jgi:hypothetical protein